MKIQPPLSVRFEAQAKVNGPKGPELQGQYDGVTTNRGENQWLSLI